MSSPISSSGLAAAQAVAAVAEIELPLGSWNDLIPILLNNMSKFDNNLLKQATLQAIGFICETIVSGDNVFNYIYKKIHM